MINIAKNNIITITAGDYFKVPIFINAGDYTFPLRYILQPDDRLYLSIMEPNQPFEVGVVRKIYTAANLNGAGDPVIELLPSDTEHLLPGLYYYELKLVINKDGEDLLSTIRPKTKFYIL